MKRLEIEAPAKVNLYLDVLRKRTDGYHDIKSLAVPITLFDRLILEKLPSQIEMLAKPEVRFAGIPWSISMGPLSDNLINRAAQLLKETTGYRGGARIILEKRIPIGSGLGGGSADAAAVLKGLNILWRTKLTPKEIMQLGAQLGSDIPALIQGGAVEMTGRGERIRPIYWHRRTPLWLVLVNPGFSIATGDIYSRFITGLTSNAHQHRFASILRGLEEGSLDQVAAGLFNALQETVLRKYPLLKIIHNELEKAQTKGVLLSGSGPTVFALVESRAQGYRLKKRIRAALDFPLWTCVALAVAELEKSEPVYSTCSP